MPFPLSLFYIASAFCAFLLLYTNRVHMFQLNAYKFVFHRDWMKNNRTALLLKAVPAVLSAALFFVPSVAAHIAACGCNLVFALLYLPKKAKKPLVFTTRVKRLYVTGILLFALCCFGTDLAPFCEIPLLLGSFFMLLCNLINRPLENAVRRHYINEAKNKIASLPSLTVIGITGSYGKTGTKYILNRLLSEKYNVLMTPASYNTTMGVVKTVREQLTAAHDIFICEMGARNVGEIKEICDIVRPKYGIITSIGPCHLETFGSIENVLRTKFELCDALPTDGILFLNNDNEYLAAKRDIPRQTVRYGLAKGADVTAEILSLSEKGTEFCVHDGNDSFTLTAKLLGAHNIVNVLGCVALCRRLGVSVPELILGSHRLESTPHRLSMLRGNGFVILDDAFNSNPAGAEAALAVLAGFEGQKILITPGMIELGELQDECNEAFGKRAAAICDYIFLVGEKQTRAVRRGIESTAFSPERLQIFEKVEDAICTARVLPGGVRNVILIENDLPDNF